MTSDDEVRRLRERVALLREALRQIAEHPHCVYGPLAGEGLQYAIGVADGHRCAALMARDVLRAADPALPPSEKERG